MLDRTFEEAVLAAATAMGLHGCVPPLLLQQQQHTSSTLSAKGNKTASQSGEQAGGKDVGKETADGSKEEAEGQGEGSSGEDSQDMMDERAGACSLLYLCLIASRETHGVVHRLQ